MATEGCVFGRPDELAESRVRCRISPSDSTPRLTVTSLLKEAVDGIRASNGDAAHEFARDVALEQRWLVHANADRQQQVGV